MASRKCGRMFRPTAQWFNVDWLQRWAVGSNRPWNVCLSGELSVQRPTVIRWFVWQINKEKITAFITLKVDDMWCRDGSLRRNMARCVSSCSIPF